MMCWACTRVGGFGLCSIIINARPESYTRTYKLDVTYMYVCACMFYEYGIDQDLIFAMAVYLRSSTRWSFHE